MVIITECSRGWWSGQWRCLNFHGVLCASTLMAVHRFLVSQVADVTGSYVNVQINFVINTEKNFSIPIFALLEGSISQHW